MLLGILAMHGAVMFYVAWHFDRCQLLVPLLGWLHVVLGTFMIGVDINAGMPLYWIAGEGLPIALTGGAILWLFPAAMTTLSMATKAGTSLKLPKAKSLT